MKASFPHSSSTEGLRYFPARDHTADPALSQPVRFVHTIRGFARMCSDCDPEL